MQNSFIEFIKSKETQFFNFYYLTGEDYFAHQLVVKKLLNKYIPKDMEDFNYSAVEIGKDKQISDLVSIVLSYPAFCEHRIVHIKNASALDKESAAKLIANFKNMPDKTIVIVSSETATALTKNGLDAYLKKNGCAVKCALSDSDITEYIKIKFKKNKIEIKNDLVYLLASKTGHNSLSQLDSEIEKLIAHSKQSGAVAKQDIENLVTQNTFAKIYHLSDFIAGKKLKESISMVETLAKEEGDEFIYTVLGYLNKHFKILLSIKSLMENGMPVNKIAAEIGIKQEYYFKNCLKQSSNFSSGELVRFFDCFQKADFNIKNSQDPLLTLELMLTSMCKN